MDAREKTLRDMKICRFCLSSDINDLTNIYHRAVKDAKMIPLPVQIMSCVSIEVFANDGLPQLICNGCRQQTNLSYIFKTNCKKADDALKMFLQTGSLFKEDLPNPSKNRQKASQPSPVNDIRIVSSKNKTNIIENPTTKRIKLEDGTEIITLSISSSNSQEAENQVEENINETMMEQEEQERSDFEDGEFVTDDPEEGSLTVEQMNNVNQIETNCFPCSQCDRTFPLKQLLDLHVSNHERERHFQCGMCEKKFFNKYDQSKHEQTHQSFKPYECVICRKTFNREALLRRHEIVHNDVPKYLCTQCDKTYLTKDDLDLHTLKHDKRRPFACRICNKSFVFKQGLERHMLTHSQDKPHKCNYCEASFNSAIRLTRHITTHAGLRPYPCKICARTFLLSHHLTRHMRSHYAAGMGRQPEEAVGQHKCDICSMSFRRKDSLINHSAIHSMVNLRCVICNTSFDTANMVKEHITTHLQGLPFPCEKCDYSFETAEQLEEHEVKHAEMEYEEQIEKEVISEVKRQMSAGEESEDEYLEEGEVTDFHITGLNNPKVLQSQQVVTNKHAKSTNETQSNPELTRIFKNELEDLEPEEHLLEEAQPGEEGEQEEQSIKPIFRIEGTKMYERKGPINRKIPNLTSQSQATSTTASLEQINEPPSVENMNIPSGSLKYLPSKRAVNVKVGDKMVKVQKFIISKEEMKQMAKMGILEVKNGQVIMKHPGQSILNATIKPVQQSDLDSLMSQKQQKPQIKKYQRRTQENYRFTENDDDIVQDFE